MGIFVKILQSAFNIPNKAFGVKKDSSALSRPRPLNCWQKVQKCFDALNFMLTTFD